MSHVKTICQAIVKHRRAGTPSASPEKCTACPWMGWHHEHHVAQEIIRAIERAESITTVDALEALPIPTPEALSGTLIRAVGIPAFGEVYERNTDGTWCKLQDPSGADWGDRMVASQDIPLPAHVLWVPLS